MDSANLGNPHVLTNVELEVEELATMGFRTI